MGEPYDLSPSCQLSVIAAQGRWSPRSPAVLGYIRTVDNWRNNPMKGNRSLTGRCTRLVPKTGRSYKAWCCTGTARSTCRTRSAVAATRHRIDVYLAGRGRDGWPAPTRSASRAAGWRASTSTTCCTASAAKRDCRKGYGPGCTRMCCAGRARRSPRSAGRFQAWVSWPARRSASAARVRLGLAAGETGKTELSHA
jgi:hypothetical protein